MALFSVLGNILFPSLLLPFFIVSDVFAETYSNGHCYGIVAKSPHRFLCSDTWSPAGGAILGGCETFRRRDLNVGSGSLRGWRGDRLVLV